MSARDNVRALVERLVAELGVEACRQFVVVGGTAPALYEGSDRVPLRMTEDVDVVVADSTFLSWRRAVEVFERNGFKNQSTMCRYRKDELIVDVLPSDPSAISLRGSEWFRQVHASRRRASGVAIDVVDPLVLFALKLEANDDRATGRIGGDKDVEDIVAVLANVDGLIDVLRDGREPLHTLLRGKLHAMFDGADGRERLQIYMPSDAATQRFATELHHRLIDACSTSTRE